MNAKATISPHWTTQQGRDAYLAENGFTVGAYEEKWTKASFFAIDFAVPNTERHRRAIMLHDLHHVATGYGTDIAGEAEISAWELRGGLRGLDAYVRSIIVAGALAGVLLYPRRTLRAWKAARGARTLWSQGARYDDLLPRPVEALRAAVGVPPAGLAEEPPGLHKRAPSPVAARA